MHRRPILRVLPPFPHPLRHHPLLSHVGPPDGVSAGGAAGGAAPGAGAGAAAGGEYESLADVDVGDEDDDDAATDQCESYVLCQFDSVWGASMLRAHCGMPALWDESYFLFQGQYRTSNATERSGEWEASKVDLHRCAGFPSH